VIDHIPLDMPGVLLIRPKRFEDERGFFTESYNRRAFAQIGVAMEFVQDNHSLSAMAGTLRGLHFQSPPSQQAKLVRVTRGRVIDVVVDLRTGSPTFGGHVWKELSAETGEQIFVPVGCAHGFLTLTNDVEVQYKTSGYYDPARDDGVRYDDPDLNIDWRGLAEQCGARLENLILSDKDRALPRLTDSPSPFQFEPDSGPA